MDAFGRLAELLRRFPGIGPRQAQRFVFFLLTQSPVFHRELSDALLALHKNAQVCSRCFRYYAKERSSKQCAVCDDDTREKKVLMVVEKDIDLENIEKSKTFSGYYFVLGGNLPILEKYPEKKVRIGELKKRASEKGVKEIILALSATPDGDNTVRYLKEALMPVIEQHNISITLLGRGLSTGSELEYIDPETIKNALENRS